MEAVTVDDLLNIEKELPEGKELSPWERLLKFNIIDALRDRALMSEKE
jgi:hypothetical protein